MARRSNGEGAITRRKDGRWQASLQMDGKRKTVYGKTRAEAAAKLAELQRQAAKAGSLPDPGRRTVGDLLDAWLETVTPNLKPATIAQYTLECDKHIRPALGNLRLAKVSPDRLQRLYAGLRKSGRGRTAELVHALLRQAFGLAVLWRWLPENPCERVVRPTHQAERKELWSPDELRRFLDGTRDHWLGPLWALLAYSGCRLGEALALEWADIDLTTGRVVVSKTIQRIGGEWVVTEPKTKAGVRVITLPAEAIDALRRQAERRLAKGMQASGGGALVFASNGQPLHRATVAHAMRRECDRLGLPPVTPHGLRHLHASLLLAQGLPVPAVSQRLGHANSAITMAVYAHAIGKDDSAATAAIARAIGAGR